MESKKDEKKKSVRDYLGDLVWDQTSRIDRWLVDYVLGESVQALIDRVEASRDLVGGGW